VVVKSATGAPFLDQRTLLRLYFSRDREECEV